MTEGPRRSRRPWRPWNVSYALVSRKERIAYIAFAACLGAFFASERNGSAALGALIGVLVALLRIWLEVRQHDPPE
jgi:hypothetical protein